MPPRTGLGELEQLMLLAVAARGNSASGREISSELEATAGRSVSKGALYATLERLERKGLLIWKVSEGDRSTSDLPKRHFTVTAQGLKQLRESTSGVVALWRLAADIVGESPK